MKIIVITFLLIQSLAYGQRRQVRSPYERMSMFDQFKKEDSIERLYLNDTLLNVITDPLPLYTLDENSGWRDMQLVSYFYDSSKILKKICFRHGREGYYYFYFQKGFLRKA